MWEGLHFSAFKIYDILVHGMLINNTFETLRIVNAWKQQDSRAPLDQADPDLLMTIKFEITSVLKLLAFNF